MTKKQLLTGEKYAGVDVTYDRPRRLVTLSGWYDTYTGIAPETVTLTHLLHALGITVKDCEKALESVMHGAACANCGDTDVWTYFDGEAGICIDPKACKVRVDARNAQWEAEHDQECP